MAARVEVCMSDDEATSDDAMSEVDVAIDLNHTNVVSDDDGPLMCGGGLAPMHSLVPTNGLAPTRKGLVPTDGLVPIQSKVVLLQSGLALVVGRDNDSPAGVCDFACDDEDDGEGFLQLGQGRSIPDSAIAARSCSPLRQAHVQPKPNCIEDVFTWPRRLWIVLKTLWAMTSSWLAF
jgi:hypothetical protein